MSTSSAPDQGQAGGARSTATKTNLNLTRGLRDVADAELVRSADLAVRAALREGVTGPDIEELLSWVTEQRIRLRRGAASVAVADVLSEIRRAS